MKLCILATIILTLGVAAIDTLDHQEQSRTITAANLGGVSQ